MVKRYTKAPVGAHYGTGDWLLQRLTAVVMAVYTIGFAACIVWHKPGSFADWKAIFGGGIVKVSTLLFFAALLYHAWVGMRDIVMDYVKPTGIRLALETAIGGVLIVYLVWAASILWGAR
jgi:succinate dehydrogenase / fumarate reductase membrane anchor subunit